MSDDQSSLAQLEAAVAARTAEIKQELAELRSERDALRRRLEDSRKTMEGTIHAMALALEMRDPYTAGHQQFVSRIATGIGEEMKLSKNEVEGLSMAGQIHDLGKISVPAEILCKPGRLTDIEFAMIKTHAQVGHDILEEIDFPWPVAQIVLQHHERMDGSGYPQGLAGEDILLEARIMAVADVVEAMASHRPYRPALGIEAATGEITGNKQRLYDPQVVEACQKLFEKWF